MKPVTMIMTLAATVVLALPAAPASAAPVTAASVSPNSPAYCLVFPILPQCRYLLN
nr:hypothetical protein [Propionicimonas sp.]